MQLFYSTDVSSDIVQLSRDESAHAVRSLRMRPGETIMLTDGKGTLAEGIILTAESTACTVQVIVRTFRERRAGYGLHLAVAPTKNADRIEWLVEKAVEIGIDEITPLITRRTERTRLNRDRIDKIAVSAMKQSLHTHLPIIHHETRFEDFIGMCPDSENSVRMICHAHYSHPLSIVQAYQPGRDAVLVIGPEGDFAEDEIALADCCGFLPVTLGTYRLRTETAAMMAVCAINLINNPPH